MTPPSMVQDARKSKCVLRAHMRESLQTSQVGATRGCRTVWRTLALEPSALGQIAVPARLGVWTSRSGECQSKS
eukprot:15446157-Alexandrium_andersonii.AAC.1